MQRGRTCVRPACAPVLSVVPAVSDLELSETEYVRPVGPPGSAHPSPGQIPKWSTYFDRLYH